MVGCEFQIPELEDLSLEFTKEMYDHRIPDRQSWFRRWIYHVPEIDTSLGNLYLGI
jgi:hypothetical protein